MTSGPRNRAELYETTLDKLRRAEAGESIEFDAEEAELAGAFFEDAIAEDDIESVVG